MGWDMCAGGQATGAGLNVGGLGGANSSVGGRVNSRPGTMILAHVHTRIVPPNVKSHSTLQDRMLRAQSFPASQRHAGRPVLAPLLDRAEVRGGLRARSQKSRKSESYRLGRGVAGLLGRDCEAILEACARSGRTSHRAPVARLQASPRSDSSSTKQCGYFPRLLLADADGMDTVAVDPRNSLQNGIGFCGWSNIQIVKSAAMDLQTLALPLGYAAIHLSANGFVRRPPRTGYTGGYTTHPLDLSADHIVGDSAVPLRGHDRAVTQELLKGGKTTATFQPRASERVPQLVEVKSLHARVFSHLVREGSRLDKRDQLPHTAPHLVAERCRKWNSPDLARFRVVHDLHALLHIGGLRPRQLAPSKPSAEPHPHHERVRFGDRRRCSDLVGFQPVRWSLLEPRHDAPRKRRPFQKPRVLAPPEHCDGLGS